ncbi:hypothetical protein BDP81DRAFT_198419 [Colletotrichum phormii]|uniref:Uncharacterized protein n=1 Tax=Colletotrichum phormii TaxID=359342 RepID=A0AAJ0EJQ8_9PEZI|nr:uncharacterized protein BDP81DRAFT_198419 [Colletotrichum phormii]KAK1639190.1 hypothetical protein BDP81DRAFT_198419 [Colletotrichum phormii]
MDGYLVLLGEFPLISILPLISSASQGAVHCGSESCLASLKWIWRHAFLVFHGLKSGSPNDEGGRAMCHSLSAMVVCLHHAA